MKISIFYLLMMLGCFLENVWAQSLPIEHWETALGTPVYFVKTSDLPMCDISVVFDAGSVRDGEKEGIANLTADVLNSGTDNFTQEEIAKKTDELGIQLNGALDKEMSVVSLRTLTDKNVLPQSLSLFHDVLVHPNFPMKAFLRERRSMLRSMLLKQQNPEELGEKAFYAALYGNHPYAHDVLGNEASVQKIQQKDLLDFYHRYYVTRNAMITLVGNLEVDEAKALAEKLLEGMPAGENAAALPNYVYNGKNENTQISFPSAQTHVFYGTSGINYDHPRFWALMLGNFILGGGDFSSRLFYNVREKQGLVYHVFSAFIPQKLNGPFLSGLQTKNDQTKKAMDLVKQTIEEFIQKGPTDSEVDMAKKAWLGRLEIAMDSNASINEFLIKIGFYHLPLNRFELAQTAISNLKREEVMAAFKEFFDHRPMVTIQVGPHSKN